MAVGLPATGWVSGQTAPWHLSGWKARVVLEIPQPQLETDVDTAGAKIYCQGRAKTDGSDYRVLDDAGAPVPFQLVFHDAGRYSLLSFRCADPRRRYYVYYDNPAAARAAEQIADPPAPGGGPPGGAWVPRCGLVYTTLARPEGDNPREIEELTAMIKASRRLHGARYQRRISDGYNPFGPSDNFISVYRGWLRIPQGGKYWFCTVSNEGSFSFLDGKPLIHWPGRHTEQRGIHGEKHAAVELAAGLHYIEYYHEDVQLQQMAFLGWRPRSDSGLFQPIPETVYPAPHHAAVVAAEDATGGPLAQFEPVIADSVWPLSRSAGQYTKVTVKLLHPPAREGLTVSWDFGDGQTATGAEAAHVFLALGDYTVAARVTGAGVNTGARWPLEVFLIQSANEQFKEGDWAEYLRLARSYDRGKLDAASLAEYIYLLAEGGASNEVLQAAAEFAARFGGTQAAMLPGIRKAAADAALRLGAAGVDEAIAGYQEALRGGLPLERRLETTARLIRLLAIERQRGAEALTLYQAALTNAPAAMTNEEIRTGLRSVLIAAGDMYLQQDDRANALTNYHRAEYLYQTAIPPQVRAARLGAFPAAVRELAGRRQYPAALEKVDQWENVFPSDKVKGQTFFWRGKVLTLAGRAGEAVAWLKRAAALGIGASYETEIQWFLAQALEQTQQSAEAKAVLTRLAGLGFDDKFTQMARERIKNAASGK
jgi:tetratricopeptide (TPR) repeat protein